MAQLKDLIVTGPARIIGTLYAQDASTATAGLVKLGGGTTNFLRADGTWAAPTFSQNTAYIYAGASNGSANATTTNGNTYLIIKDGSSVSSRVKLGSGKGISVTSDASGNVTIQHTHTDITAGTVGTSSATSGSTLAVPYVTYDAQGHITATGTHTHTVTGFLTSSSTLDATKLSGTIPTASLPSYVDDVLEYDAKANFPSTGETGKIYVDKTTNLTWRWGGSAYVEISPSLALGNTAATAAKGNHTHTVTATGTVATSTATTENKTATVSAASSGTTTYTPAGTNSAPTFTGTAATISVSKSYTPAGSVAAPTFTGTKATGLTVSPASSGTATYTPEGTVSQPTFSGTAATISVSKSYTPAGTVSTPTISVKTAGTTTSAVTGTSVTNEVLSFTTANVKNGDAAYQSTQPTFTGTAATITSTGSYTPAGTVSQPTFTGTGKRLVLQDYTPAGTNSAPAFTGTAATITSTGSYTPAGSVSAPTFTGTAVRLVTGNIAVPKTYTSTFTGTSATTSVPA